MELSKTLDFLFQVLLRFVSIEKFVSVPGIEKNPIASFWLQIGNQFNNGFWTS
jgi:hypothetical protein